MVEKPRRPAFNVGDFLTARVSETRVQVLEVIPFVNGVYMYRVRTPYLSTEWMAEFELN